MRRKSLFGKNLSIGDGHLRNSAITAMLLAITVSLILFATPIFAQTGGQGAIQGTVTDASGAVVPDAKVTATNQDSGVATVRPTSSAGLFEINPIIPGTYTVTATAKGFQTFKQQNLVVDALKVTGLNISLVIGGQDQTVTVTEAPPALNTTSATLGGVIENSTYTNLPLQMNGQQRDPTAFATLLPGVQAQGSARAPIVGGTGNYIAEVYVDGLPTTTANQQGDNRVVSNSIPVEAIDQFQVLTSVPGAEYQGAGALNFTIKSGGNQYHGTVADFVRNTIFDTWGFSAPALTQQDANGNTIPATKPVEHQNELVGAVGGPIPFTHKKGFFFATYDKYHGRNGINPNNLTVPTTLMRSGDFTELSSTTPIIYDPATNACTVTGCTRQPFMGMKNGLPTLNVIPASRLSPITQYMQKFLPAPTNSGIVGNYLGGVPSGYDNWEFLSKVDYDITAAQRISVVLTLGSRTNVPFTVGTNVPAPASTPGVVFPLPYTAGGYATIKPTIIDFEHSIVIKPNLVNQFKFGFTRFSQPITSLTDGAAPYRAAADVGITNLPPGQASDEFPGVTFNSSTAFPNVQNPWTSNGATGATQTTVPNSFTLVDNLQWIKGKHSFTFGIQMQWLQDNVSAQLGPSGIFTTVFSPNDTADYSGTSISSTKTGYSYASYLLGAINSSSTTIQSFSEEGGRYRPISPYFQDDWKATQKLTLNLGLRYDYFPPYEEVQDRWSYLNPNGTNPVTGTPGVLEFAGNRGASISCQCRTPVHTYMKNWGPRLGFAYSYDDKTVIRGGYALVYSRAGGVGGRAGAGTGTSQAGFTANLVLPSAQTTGVTAAPSYYLDSSNTAFGGPGFQLPAPATPSAASLSIGTGNYINSSGAVQAAGAAPGYADPYLSGRAPEVNFYNFGIQRAVTKDLTLTVDYVGSNAHFLSTGANARGLWAGQMNPVYLAALGALRASDGTTPLLSAPATPANIAIAANAMSGIATPYAGYTAAAAKSSAASISHMLTAFPQYSGTTDTWGNVGNVSYNSLQITVNQREWKGLSYTLNYTYSKNLGDDNTFRTGFDTPAAATSNGVGYRQGRADRSYTIVAAPQNLAAYGVYKLPFGQSGFGGDHLLVRALAGGWQLSSIFTYGSGVPLAVTYAGCNSPGQGQCMPDVNPNFSGSARINHGWGKGITAAKLGAAPSKGGIQYINLNAFSVPNNYGTTAPGQTSITKIGDAPRTAPYQLWNPSTYELDASLRRTFNITQERVKFIFEVDCLNVPNKVTFGGISTAWVDPTASPTAAAASNFGTVGSAKGNRDFQLAGRVNF
ncbi:TonB-dependent receptor [Tunturiibacter lichenicola]|uniref:TonB-dependent receptor n=1 Tax=Tunturiibacter lichenicola TaxID=2051959 RepID=UPI0021B24D69|nr:Plug and carboxypeptidase regulatory-like domain-containing protein [Edaphobacter lichenicola]